MDKWLRELGLVRFVAEEPIQQQKTEQERRMQQLSRQCQKEIAQATERLYQLIAGVAQNQGKQAVSTELAQGANELAVYAFYQVIREQGGQPTQEQGRLLEVYCRQLRLPYNDMDFLLAVNYSNGVRQHLESLFQLPQGSFWGALWSAIQGCGQEEGVLSALVQLYGDILMRYSILGDPDSEAPVILMKQLVDSLNQRLERQESQEPEKPNYVQAYQKMTAAYQAVAEASRAEQDGLPVQDLYTFFILGLAHKLLRSVKLSLIDKAAVMDGVIRACELPVDLTGQSILDSIYSRDEIGGTIHMMTEFEPQHGNLWQLMRAMAIKSGRLELLTVFLENGGLFLEGLEQAIAMAYPGAVRPGAAEAYIRQVAEEMGAASV